MYLFTALETIESPSLCQKVILDRNADEVLFKTDNVCQKVDAKKQMLNTVCQNTHAKNQMLKKCKHDLSSKKN